MAASKEAWDRAIDLSAPNWWAASSLPLFALYFGGVLGGSIVQSLVFPGPHVVWLQQFGGIFVIALVSLFLPNRRVLFVWVTS